MATPGIPIAGAPMQLRKTNGFAIAALVLAFSGVIPLSIVFAIVALAQIRRTKDQGRGLAITGIVVSVAWVVIIAVGAMLGIVEAINADQERSPSGASLRLFPRPGECFDIPADEASANVTIVSCDQPHDAQVVVAFKLSKSPWPGEDEIERQAFAGCEQRILATFKTRVPVENASPYVLFPRRLGWFAGDRTVSCALAADDGEQLTAPIPIRDSGRREWSELAVRDCFNDPRGGRTSTVKLVACNRPHTAQVTYTFTLPQGRYPGESVVTRKAEQGCSARNNAYFRRYPAQVPVDEWHVYPTQESWALGDREVVCYVTGTNGRMLHRSVMPH